MKKFFEMESKKGYHGLPLQYTRCAHMFIVGFTGTFDEAKQIKQNINLFLRTELILDISPNINEPVAANEGVKFLGVDIKVLPYEEDPSIIRLEADLKDVITKLREAGFCDKQGKPIPHFAFYDLTHNNIIECYNEALEGILAYFRFAKNYNDLGFTVQSILINSCAILLAAKFGLGTTQAVYRK